MSVVELLRKGAQVGGQDPRNLSLSTASEQLPGFDSCCYLAPLPGSRRQSGRVYPVTVPAFEILIKAAAGHT